MLFQGLGGRWFTKKTWSKKFRDIVPLNSRKWLSVVPVNTEEDEPALLSTAEEQGATHWYAPHVVSWVQFVLYKNKEGFERREIITVRGQSYVSRIPKYWPPHPPLRPTSVYPRLCCGGRTHSPGGEGGRVSIFWKTRDIGLHSNIYNLSTGLSKAGRSISQKAQVRF